MRNYIKSLVVIAVVVATSVFIFSELSKQSPSDCSLAENYDSKTSKCVLKTGSEYASEIANEEKRAEEIATETNRRNGTECIPSSEVMNYIGVTGCVRMPVRQVYRSKTGTVFLNSDANDYSKFSVVSFYGDPLSYAEALGYLDHSISVRGEISLYKTDEYGNEPQIILKSKDNIFNPVSFEEIEARQASIRQKLMEDSKEIFKKETERYQKIQSCINTNSSAGKSISECGNISSQTDAPKSTDTLRRECFDEKIKDAGTKYAKDSVYNSCKNQAKETESTNTEYTGSKYNWVTP